jgi:Fe-S-cluster-containing dehydrogenase component/CRP-like cAMP-binding protein
MHEHKSRRALLDAIEGVPSLSSLLSTHYGHFDYELDLEVTIYGRNYRGKNVGPYFRLLTFEPGETIVSEGEWGGNTFYIVAKGSAEIFVKSPANRDVRIKELGAGSLFGIMSVLAGIPRRSTVKASVSKPVDVIEIQRPAIRLLRKLNKFASDIDTTSRIHGRDAMIEELKSRLNLTSGLMNELKKISSFRILAKNHTLFRENAPMDHIFIIRDGWIRRGKEVQIPNEQSSKYLDFLGNGYCLGTEGIIKNTVWPYSTVTMGRSEVLEISISMLRTNVSLREAFIRELPNFTPPTLGPSLIHKPKIEEKVLATQEELISTGLVDGTNLFIVDTNLCIHCGNCSFACHKIHGQSRFNLRGITLTRLKRPTSPSLQNLMAPSVCLHCQAPECLTGCPTGSIGRFAAGQIDIDLNTCIGCGDCAIQCPYNAISLIPRKNPFPQIQQGLRGKLSNFFRLKNQNQPAIENTEDLVAVMCNLCSDRETLNPKGNKKQKFSCEINCPTGALSCIKPKEYFHEIGKIQGLLFLNNHRAVGHGIQRIDWIKRLLHLGGISVIGLSIILIWFVIKTYGYDDHIYSFFNVRWITALIGLFGMLVAMSYSVRRQIYQLRAGALRYWLLAHTYAGVLAGLMILVHGSNNSGGLLTTALMWSFDGVILTGLFGTLAYFFAPRMMTRIEGAPLLLDDLKARRNELQQEIARVVNSPSEPLRQIVMKKVIPRFVNSAYLIRQYLQREKVDDLIIEAKAEYKAAGEQLLEARLVHDLKNAGFESQIALAKNIIANPANETFLIGLPEFANVERRMQFTRAIEAAKDERRNLKSAVEAAATVRRVDALIYLHHLLKLWLPPHILSVSLMLILMLIHIAQVIYYLVR